MRKLITGAILAIVLGLAAMPGLTGPAAAGLGPNVPAQNVTTTNPNLGWFWKWAGPQGVVRTNAVDVACPDGQLVTSGHLSIAQAEFLCGLVAAYQ